MILKLIQKPLLLARDEAEAIAVLNEFIANIGKKHPQESKIQSEEQMRVCLSSDVMCVGEFPIAVMQPVTPV